MSESPASRKSLFAALTVGVVIRLVLAAISTGSNDALAWREFADRVTQGGLYYAYRSEWLLNHPPMMIWWSWIALKVGGDGGFSFFMKLPAIAADGLSCVLLWKIWIRQNARCADGAAIAMAFSPLAILLSGYHCNTDNVYAFLALLAMYFIADQRSFFLAGLALGAAINVKLIPVILIPALFALCRTRREIVRVFWGLALCAIPFLFLLPVHEVVREKMFGYIPPPERWGVELILHEASLVEQIRDVASVLMEKYQAVGQVLIVIGICALSLIQWLRSRWNAYELGFLCFAFFLIVTPGFGVQYMIGVLPLMLAVTIPRGWIYSALGGIFLLIAYLMTLTSKHIPFSSYFPGPVLLMPAPLVGFLAWWVLTETAAKMCASFRKKIVP